MQRTLPLLLLLLSGLSIQAQSTDWATVQNVPAYTRVILITGRHRTACLVTGTDDGGIGCEWKGAGWWVPREDVRKVLLPARKATVIGAIAGAAVGSTLVIAKGGGGSDVPGAGTVSAIALGACVGSLIGHLIDTGHGRVLYLHP